MKHRKLRIAWSVTWGVVAVLLCVLWVRSYWWAEALNVPVADKLEVGLGIMPGSFAFLVNPQWGLRPGSSISTPADKWLASVGSNHSRIWGRFGIESNGVVIPIWASLVLVASVAALSWLRHIPLQFSLRTLLIATTLIGVILGFVVWLSR